MKNVSVLAFHLSRNTWEFKKNQANVTAVKRNKKTKKNISTIKKNRTTKVDLDLS